MTTLRVTPKSNPIELPPADLQKLTAKARARACDAVLIELAPAPGCECSVIWAAV